MSVGMSNRSFYPLVAVTAALLAGELYLFGVIRGLGKETSRLEESLVAEVTLYRQSALASDHANSVEVAVLRDELKEARRQAAGAAHRAQIQAQKHAERLASGLAQQHQQQQQEVAEELNSLQAVAVAAHATIGDLDGEVKSTKTEVAATRSNLQSTVSELKQAVGDLGVLSGRIATNSQELGALKALGDRNYFEFDLKKSSEPLKIAGVSVLLRKADLRRYRYSIELLADNRKLEKKNKTLNEPVQFYVSQPRQLFELVVNQIGKNRIRGYLATPKVTRVARM